MGVKLGLTLERKYRLRVFENGVLRKTFGPMRENVTAGWRERHNEKVHKLYASTNIITVITSSRMKCVCSTHRKHKK